MATDVSLVVLKLCAVLFIVLAGLFLCFVVSFLATVARREADEWMQRRKSKRF